VREKKISEDYYQRYVDYSARCRSPNSLGAKITYQALVATDKRYAEAKEKSLGKAGYKIE